MTEERWTKKDVMARFRVKVWGTIWRWQRDHGFPLGTYTGVGGLLLFDPVAVKRWAKEQERPQFVKGRSTGERPKFNLPEAEPVDGGA